MQTQSHRRSVYTATGDHIGQLARIVLDTRTGSIRYAVVKCDPGDGSRDGGSTVEVPRATLRFDADQERLVLDVVPG